jgi:hypothetical protein
MQGPADPQRIGDGRKARGELVERDGETANSHSMRAKNAPSSTSPVLVEAMMLPYVARDERGEGGDDAALVGTGHEQDGGGADAAMAGSGLVVPGGFSAAGAWKDPARFFGRRGPRRRRWPRAGDGPTRATAAATGRRSTSRQVPAAGRRWPACVDAVVGVVVFAMGPGVADRIDGAQVVEQDFALVGADFAQGGGGRMSLKSPTTSRLRLGSSLSAARTWLLSMRASLRRISAWPKEWKPWT